MRGMNGAGVTGLELAQCAGSWAEGFPHILTSREEWAEKSPTYFEGRT